MHPVDTITVRRKAFAYITSGTRLLLFTQPDFPLAGVQVPAGTMEPGETPAQAALREVTEETGLADLRIVQWIGRAMFDARPYGRNEFNDRWFFHLRCDGEVAEASDYGEGSPADGSTGPVRFRFFWADLRTDLPELIAEHDRFIAELRRLLAIG